MVFRGVLGASGQKLGTTWVLQSFCGFPKIIADDHKLVATTLYRRPKQIFSLNTNLREKGGKAKGIKTNIAGALA